MRLSGKIWVYVFFLGFAFSSFANEVATLERAEFDGLSLAMGGRHSCAIAKNFLRCWGSDEFGQRTIPPTLSHVRAISPGGVHTCALDDTGVHCWGDESVEQLSVPALRNPQTVVSGSFLSCAVDEDGVKCWGFGHNAEVSPPPGIDPKQVEALSVGGYHGCALVSGKVRCWGQDGNGLWKAPDLDRPSKISAGGLHTCAIHRGPTGEAQVKCWGNNDLKQTEPPADLRNPTEISAGWAHTCAIGDGGVKCWGQVASGEEGKIPELVNPRAIFSGGEGNACAVDDQGVKCWGGNSEHQRDYPDELTNLAKEGGITGAFNLPTLEKKFLRISRFFYTYKGEFWRKTASDLKGFPIDFSASLKETYLKSFPRLFAFNAVAPVIEDTASPNVQSRLWPTYQASRAKINAEFEVRGLEDIEPRAAVVEVALRLSSHALLACRNFIGEQEGRQQLEQSLAQLASLIVRAAAERQQTGGPPRAIIQETRTLFAGMTNLLGTLTQQPRTRGLGLMVQSIADYFARK
jgi:Regulator of chromosome condensation (RCC1) repeat